MENGFRFGIDSLLEKEGLDSSVKKERWFQGRVIILLIHLRLTYLPEELRVLLFRKTFSLGLGLATTDTLISSSPRALEA